MTRRFFILFAGLLAICGSLRADMTNAATGKSSILENDILYLRVSQVDMPGIFVATNLAAEIQSAHNTLATTSNIAGIIFDLRFARHVDLVAGRAAADLFKAKKLPVVILVNGETQGDAAFFVPYFRDARVGLILGSGSAEFKPDIAVTVDANDELAYFKNPYADLAQAETNFSAGTNNFSPFIDHTSEADLVRAKIKDGDLDENSMPARPTEPPKPFIHDPVLARAVDLIKALAIVRQPHA